MKCPKCNYVSFDYLANCQKCGLNLDEVRSRLRFPDIKPEIPFLLGSLLEEFEGVSVKATIPPPDIEIPPVPGVSMDTTGERGGTVEIGDEPDTEMATALEGTSETGEAKITFSEDEIDRALSEDFLEVEESTAGDTDEGGSTQPLDLELSLRELDSADLSNEAFLELMGDETEPVVDLGGTSDDMKLADETEPLTFEDTSPDMLEDEPETLIETDEFVSESDFTDLDINEDELDNLAKELEEALFTAETEMKKDTTGAGKAPPPAAEKKAPEEEGEK